MILAVILFAQSVCNPPCDKWEIDYNYDGITFKADATGPYPLDAKFFYACDPDAWPKGVPHNGVDCAASVGSSLGRPRTFKLAYRVHNAAGWSPLQVFPKLFDVGPPNPYADWIEEFYKEGITAGCGTDPMRYCPTDPVTREKMAVFMLKMEHRLTPGWLPSHCVGVFTDVPCQYSTPTATPTGPTPTYTFTPAPPTATSVPATRTNTPYRTATKTFTKSRTPTPAPSKTPTKTKTPSPPGACPPGVPCACCNNFGCIPCATPTP